MGQIRRAARNGQLGNRRSGLALTNRPCSYAGMSGQALTYEQGSHTDRHRLEKTVKTIRCTRYAIALCALACLSGFSARSGNAGDQVPVGLALVRSFANPLPVHKVGFSKDGAALACFCNHEGFPDFGEVYLWDVHTGKQLRRIIPSFPHTFVAEPFARLCFWTPAGLEVQNDLAEPHRTLIPLKRLDANMEMGAICFSTDDHYLAALRKDDKSVNVWDISSGDRVARFALSEIPVNEVRRIAFDRMNRYVAVGVDSARAAGHGAVVVWDLKTAQEVLHTDEECRVFQVAFCENGDLIYGGVDRLLTGMIVVRKPADFDEARTIRAPNGIWSIAIVPNVGLVTGDRRGQVLLWDIETGKLRAVAKEDGQQVASLAVGQNGKLIASGDWDSVARLWKLVGPQKPK